MIQITHNERALYMAMDTGVNDWKISFGDLTRERDISIAAGNIKRLHEEIKKAKEKFELPADAPVYSCYEAGRDGFWIDRMLHKAGINNIVVDPASIETNRRKRRVKTDRIDARKLKDMLIRYLVLGQKKTWSVVHVPSEEAESSRRIDRADDRLKKERVGHLCRIKSLLALHGIRVKSAHVDVSGLKDWDGRSLPDLVIDEIKKEQTRLGLVDEQIKLISKHKAKGIKMPTTASEQKAAKLIRLKGIGEDTCWGLSHEFFGWRKFNNRREVGAAAGLTGSPYSSGNSSIEQGISKAGNKRVRTTMIETAWRWLQFQPNAELSKWYQLRFGSGGKRLRRIGIVALSRKLLVAFWKYLEFDLVPEGAILKA